MMPRRFLAAAALALCAALPAHASTIQHMTGATSSTLRGWDTITYDADDWQNHPFDVTLSVDADLQSLTPPGGPVTPGIGTAMVMVSPAGVPADPVRVVLSSIGRATGADGAPVVLVHGTGEDGCAYDIVLFGLRDSEIHVDRTSTALCASDEVHVVASGPGHSSFTIADVA